MNTMLLHKVYVTKLGLDKVKKEYEVLKEFKRLKTTGEMPSMLHSEEANPEYLSFQEDMSLLDVRLAEYENILQNAELIKKPEKETIDCVDLGATVVCEVNGDKDEFTLVGSLESNPAAGRISNESPVGKALLGKKIGEVVTLESPVAVTYKVLKISYD